MAKRTLIKRYANRRLYDTESSGYVTLEDLAVRLRGGEKIRVVEAQSGQDITRRILLQIIVLDSQQTADFLPEDFLYALIQLKDQAMAEMFLSYLRMGTEAFHLARSQMEKNLRRFRQQSKMTADWMSGFLPFGAPLGAPRTAAPQPGGTEGAAADGSRAARDDEE